MLAEDGYSRMSLDAVALELSQVARALPEQRAAEQHTGTESGDAARAALNRVSTSARPFCGVTDASCSPRRGGRSRSPT